MSQLVHIRSRKASGPAGVLPAAPSPEHADPGIAPAGPRVYLETLGCQMNEADSALIAGQLRARGYVRVDDPAAADVILLNTCAVREKAEERVYGRTSQLLRHRKHNPGLVFGITGCMAEHLRGKVQQHAPHIGL